MIKKALLGMLICFLFFVVFDVFLRVYLTIKNKDLQYLKFSVSVNYLTPEQFRMTSKFVQHDGYYKLQPGYYGFQRIYHPYFVNSLGFRNREFSPDKQNGVTRVCTFGGSTTFGYGVTDKQTYPYYLEEDLNRLAGRQKYEVINCGIPSYRMKHIYNLFTKEVMGYSPDMIVIYAAWNDAFMYELVSGNSIPWQIHKALYYRWMLYTLVLEKYSAIKYHSPRPFFHRHKKIMEDYATYLGLVVKKAKENNIGVVLARQPMHTPHDSFDHSLSKDELREAYSKETDAKLSGVIAHHYYIKQMEEIAKANNIPVVDIAKALEARPQIFLDDIHLDPEGNRMLADAIAKVIINGTKRAD